MDDAPTLLADPSNAEQLRIWDGDEGAYWAQHAPRYDRALAAYHAALLDAAALRPDDAVLDVGCGTGQATRDAARTATAGSALGVDLSSQMLAVARTLAAAEGVANARFLQADAQVHAFEPASFDVVLSRTGAMFFGDPVTAFANLARALRRDGRLALLTWQGPGPNEWLRELAGALSAGRDLPLPPATAPGPFALSDADRVRDVLTAAGFADVDLTAMSGPMWWGDGVEDAHRFALGQLGWMLQGLDDDGRRRAGAALRDTLQAHLGPDGVTFASATWLIRARRP
jgi:SAM-dependent methyltransferase